MMPLKSIYVTSPYGWRIHPITRKRSHHDGVDLRAKFIPAYVCFDGVIKKIANMGAYGKQVFIDHGGGTMSHYAHLSDIHIPKGQLVRAGQQIGVTGNTGTMTMAPHLHFGIKVGGQWVDPLSFLEGLEMDQAKVVSGYLGKEYDAKLIDGKTYVELRKFAEDHYIPVLDWDGKTKTVTVGGGLIEGLNDLIKKMEGDR